MEEKKSKINWWKVALIVLLFIGTFSFGFYLGNKKTISIEPITVYLPGEPVHDTTKITITKTSKVDTAKLIAQCVKDGIYTELFPEKVRTDTLIMDKQDSTKILVDWATKRDYETTLFDVDTLGKCDVKFAVQYNRVVDNMVEYDFIPVTKQQTNYVNVQRHIIPFAGAGISTLPSASVEAGLFVDQKWGLSLDGDYILFNKIENAPKFSLGLKILRMF